MLTLPPSVHIYLANEPVDLRRGHDGLFAIVRNQWRMDPFAGHLFVFVGCRGNRIKILFWDRGGFVIYYNQLASHYTSFDWVRGSWFSLRDSCIARPRAVSRSHRLQCFDGRFGGSS